MYTWNISFYCLTLERTEGQESLAIEKSQRSKHNQKSKNALRLYRSDNRYHDIFIILRLLNTIATLEKNEVLHKENNEVIGKLLGNGIIQGMWHFFCGNNIGDLEVYLTQQKFVSCLCRVCCWPEWLQHSHTLYGGLASLPRCSKLVKLLSEYEALGSIMAEKGSTENHIAAIKHFYPKAHIFH